MKFRIAALSFLLCVAFSSIFVHAQDSPKWYKGNLHTHSLWSDGDDFPDMITKRFVDRGYHFLALTDHNVLSQSPDKWMDVSALKKRSGDEALVNYIEAFGAEWVELRESKSTESKNPAKDSQEQTKPKQQVRLKPLAEFRSRFESPGKFLMIEAEEISDRAEGKPIHMNAMNLKTVIQPVGGQTVVEAINNNLRAVEEQAKQNGSPILLHLNHPNFGWAVTAEELAAVTNERFFEVFNGHPAINHLGDAKRPAVEKMWDIANTIRIDQLNAKPLFGMATDDSHHYHERPGKDASLGRGWVMVHSSELTPESLIEAMNQGDFYASSGVELESVSFNDGKIALEVKAEEGVSYKTEFIGTKKDYDRETTVQLSAEGKPMRATKVYSDDVGQVLASSTETSPSYQLTGDELFVRAVITSSKPHPNPSFKTQFEQAWTQPVGWERSR